jgi:hypothetical protein
MPNYVNDGDFTKGDRQRSTQHGAARKARRENPVYCEHDYSLEDPNVADDAALCANKAIRRSDPPRCAEHGGVHAADGRKRTEGGYVKLNDKMAKVMSGEIPLSDLDEEELARGQLRNKNGQFSGGATLVVPKAMYAKMTTELFKRADDAMKENIVSAAETLTQIMLSEQADVKDRMKAAMWLIERVMGKTPETLIVGQTQPWEQLLMNITSTEKEDYKKFVVQSAPNTDDPRW